MGKRLDPRALGVFVEALEHGAMVLQAAKAAGGGGNAEIGRRLIVFGGNSIDLWSGRR